MAQAARLFLLLNVIVCIIAACGDGEKRTADQQLRTAREELRALQSENRELKQAYGRLQKDYYALQAAHDNLKIQNRDLARWAEKMAIAFGPAVWYFGPDEKPLPRKPLPDATAPLLIQELNRLFQKADLPGISLKKIEAQTAYVRIDDESQLTQEMGTTGATSYIQVVTYTLTSLPGIDHVQFDFEAGDHALPGRYSR